MTWAILSTMDARTPVSQERAADLLSVGHTRLESMLRDGLLTSLTLEAALDARAQGWIRTGDVMAILGVNRSRVGQLVEADRLPCYQARPGGRRWYRRAQVEVIANAREARRLR